MENERELLPCPFCGKAADVNEDMDAITCVDTEGGCGFYYNIEGSVEETIKAWNTRKPQGQGLNRKEVYDWLRSKEVMNQEWVNGEYCNEGLRIDTLTDLICSKFSAPPKEQLVELDEEAIYQMILDQYNYPRDLAKAICSRFGQTRVVVSKEEIEEIFDGAYYENLYTKDIIELLKSKGVMIT